MHFPAFCKSKPLQRWKAGVLQLLIWITGGRMCGQRPAGSDSEGTKRRTVCPDDRAAINRRRIQVDGCKARRLLAQQVQAHLRKTAWNSRVFLIERQTGSALAANEAKGHVPERCMPLFAAALIWRSPYDLFFKACFVNGHPAAQPFDARRLIVIQPSLRLPLQAADQGK